MPHDLLDLAVAGKDFQALRVIKDVRFGIDSGEVVSLVEPSGCGRSNLLRIIAGLDTGYSGDVRINGKPPHLHSRDVGLIFRESRLLPWLTVAENVAFELGRKGRDHPYVPELLAEVGLSGFATAYPKPLSGGMGQRVATARGLFTQPSLLLLDEPFTTRLLVTHDVNEAAYLSDRVIVLAERPGRISGQVIVDAERPRDRRNPQLVKREAEVLTLLNDGTNGFVDLSYDLASAPRPWRALRLSSLNFAI